MDSGAEVRDRSQESGMRSVNKWKPIRVPFWILTSEFCLPVKADFRTEVRNDREDSMMRFLEHENRLAQRRRGKREMRDIILSPGSSLTARRHHVLQRDCSGIRAISVATTPRVWEHGSGRCPRYYGSIGVTSRQSTFRFGSEPRGLGVTSRHSTNQICSRPAENGLTALRRHVLRIHQM